MKKSKELIILTDYRNSLYSTVKYGNASDNGIDLQIFTDKLKNQGFEVKVMNFYQVDLLTYDFLNKYVIYQSSEDKYSFYKNYIDDVVFAIELKGGILLPSYKYFKAHHNKVFMEFLRDLTNIEGVQPAHSKKYGTLEEFVNDDNKIPYPVVIKSAAGAMSKTVRKAKNYNEAAREIKSLSKSFDFKETINAKLKRHLRHNYLPKSNFRNKFIVQPLIEDLDGDLKVLIFEGPKLFIVKRSIKNGDFRASGSGIFSFEYDLDIDLLNICMSVFNSFKTPFLSIDIAKKNGEYYLIEFQFIMFGTVAMEKSKWFFKLENGEWVKEKSDDLILEEIYADSISKFIYKN